MLKRIIKNNIILLFCFFGLLSFIGCNILAWTHGSDETVEDLIAAGDAEFKRGNYTQAADYYDQACKKDIRNSKALYGFAQAKFMGQVTMGGIKNIGNRAIGELEPDGTPRRPYEDVNFNGIMDPGEDVNNNGILDTLNVSTLVHPEDIGFSSGASGFKEMVEFFNGPIDNNGNQLDNTDGIIERLELIATGQTDGVISPNNISLNFDLAILHLMYGSSLLLWKTAIPPYSMNIIWIEGGWRYDTHNIGKSLQKDPLFLRYTQEALFEYNLALSRMIVVIENSLDPGNEDFYQFIDLIKKLQRDIAFFSP